MTGEEMMRAAANKEQGFAAVGFYETIYRLGWNAAVRAIADDVRIRLRNGGPMAEFADVVAFLAVPDADNKGGTAMPSNNEIARAAAEKIGRFIGRDHDYEKALIAVSITIFAAIEQAVAREREACKNKWAEEAREHLLELPESSDEDPVLMSTNEQRQAVISIANLLPKECDGLRVAAFHTPDTCDLIAHVNNQQMTFEFNRDGTIQNVFVVGRENKVAQFKPVAAAIRAGGGE